MGKEGLKKCRARHIAEEILGVKVVPKRRDAPTVERVEDDEKAETYVTKGGPDLDAAVDGEEDEDEWTVEVNSTCIHDTPNVGVIPNPETSTSDVDRVKLSYLSEDAKMELVKFVEDVCQVIWPMSTVLTLPHRIR